MPVSQSQGDHERTFCHACHVTDHVTNHSLENKMLSKLNWLNKHIMHLCLGFGLAFAF